jgi:hypothetical protein
MFKILIQSFIAPRGREYAAIATDVVEFADYDSAEAAVAEVESKDHGEFPYTKAIRLYAQRAPTASKAAR